MQTPRAIAGRVLVALSFRNPGVANIAGKEVTVAHIFMIHARGTRAYYVYRQLRASEALAGKMGLCGAQIMPRRSPTDLGARGSDR